MKSALLTFLFVLSACGPALARLGETEKDIVARFGEGQPSDIQRQVGAQTLKFLKNGIQIEVVIYQGKSVWEIYQKKDGSGAFPEADIKNLLDAYKEPKETKRTWRYDRRDKRWESAGKPKYVAYLWPGHEDFFCIKDLTVCEVLDKTGAGTKGF